MDQSVNGNQHNFLMPNQHVSDSSAKAVAQERENPFLAFQGARGNTANKGSASPTKSEASASSLSLDIQRADQLLHSAPVAQSGRRPMRSPSLNSASQLLAERIMSQLNDNSIKRRGHRRTQSESLHTGMGDAMETDHPSLFGSDRDAEEALISELLILNNNNQEDSPYAEILRQNNANTLNSSFSLFGQTGQGTSGYHSRSLSIDDGLLGGISALTANMDTGSPGKSDSQDKGTKKKDKERGGGRYENLDDLDGEEAIRRVLASNKKIQDAESIDPKRAKRILANRQSAARSKERKTRYISELEEKVAFYEKQATALKATLTLLQRETTSLAEVNEGMTKKMQLMEKLYRQKEAENKQLLDEVEILRQAAGRGVSVPGSNAASGNLNLDQQMLALLQQHHPQHNQQHQQSLQQHSQQHQQVSQLQQQNQNHSLQQKQVQHFTQQQQQQLLALQYAMQNSGGNEGLYNGNLNGLTQLGNGSLNLLKNEGRQ